MTVGRVQASFPRARESSVIPAKAGIQCSLGTCPCPHSIVCGNEGAGYDAPMSRLIAAALLLASGGCVSLPPPMPDASPCAAGEASYACQVERYHNVNVD